MSNSGGVVGGVGGYGGGDDGGGGVGDNDVNGGQYHTITTTLINLHKIPRATCATCLAPAKGCSCGPSVAKSNSSEMKFNSEC